GIDKYLIEDLIYEIDPDEALDKIREVIERKYYRNLNDEKGVQRIIAALARMGHDYSDIRAVIRELTDDEYRYY
ncbi:MAG: regulatory protein RecX, partial [Clostridiales bacterium]|nr:regulatory protein RecX [Clostridiales bacterium]